jgi:hypothetical protein
MTAGVVRRISAQPSRKASRFTKSFACCGCAVRIDSPLAWPLTALADLFRAFSAIDGEALEPAFSLRRRRRGEYQVVRHLPGGANEKMPVGREHLVPILERAVNQRFAESIAGTLVLHAAAVACGGKALLLPAPSGSGKTTLAVALVERGCGYLTDELALLDLRTQKVAPYPKALSLKAGSFRYFERLDTAHASGGNWYLDPERLRAGSVVRRPLRVGGMFFPRYQPGAAAELEPLTPGETTLALFANTVNIASYKEKGLDLLIDLAREVRGYRLVFGDLSAACEAVLSPLFHQADAGGWSGRRGPL